MSGVVRSLGTLTGTGAAYLIGITNAALYCLVVFGVTLSNEQQAAIVGIVNAVLVGIVHAASVRVKQPPAAP